MSGATAGRLAPRVAASPLRDRLVDGVRALGLDVADPQLAALLDYLDLLVRWNRVYNLTAIRDPMDMLTLHLLDSLAVLPLVRSIDPTTVLDVGTGPGLPGIPLAIQMARTSFDLVDAVAKKVAFLQQARTALNLSNVQPHRARIEALTLARKPDLIISRAYADLPTMLGSIEHLASGMTTVVAMKGAIPTEEIARTPAGWRVDEVVPLSVPGLGAQRCAVILRRATQAGA